jgi:N-acetyl-anhydromuramyl-L-alanine amidase AmpD
LTPTDVSVVDLFLDSTAAAQILGDELKQMIATPQLRIGIPGLSFTSADKLVQVTGDDGATYMYFPFLGEYLAAMYKYAIAVMGIIAVIMIIVGGVVWITSGGIPERVNQAKTIIIRSVVGMILAVGSYTLLYTINPELVQFRNLKVLTIQGVPLTDIADIDFRTGGSASTNEFSDTILASNTAGGPDIATDATRCEASPSQSSGIGDTKYLGQLDCNSSRTRKSLLDIKNIILHDGGRTAKGTVNYWKSNCQKTGKCVNTHYFIERNGTVYQLLDEKKVAIHTPSWNSASIGIDLATVGPTDRSTASCLACKKNGTCKTYSGKLIKEKDTTDSKEEAIKGCSKGFTEAQYTSLKKIIDSIVARTGVTKDGESIRAHCNASGNHSDPVGFDWSKIGISPKQSQSCSFNPEYSQKLQADADKIFGS